MTRASRQRFRVLADAGDPSVPHGLNGYGNWGCRCKICRAANTAAMAAQVAKPVRDDKHGTLLNFRRGCRCEACVARQHAEYLKRKPRALMRRVQRNQESRVLPWRTSRQWSAEDHALCARRDLTIEQVAKLTGRTVSAIRSRRHRIRSGQVG